MRDTEDPLPASVPGIPCSKYDCLHANQDCEPMTPLDVSKSRPSLIVAIALATTLQGAGGLVAQLMAFTSDLFLCRR